jgi:outer membrane murein-binding lipoprotein Lpp
MNFFSFHKCLLCLGCCLLGAFTGCGGGGSSQTTAATDTTAPVVTPPVVTPPVVTTTTLGSNLISGVVSTGAPVMGAVVRVLDANGVAVLMTDAANGQSSIRTSVADGSFRLNLTSTTQNLPLLFQVSGVDASGLPVVLHSALYSSNLPLIVNVTPATEAVLAMVAGVNPRELWTNVAANSASIKQIGTPTVMTAASDLIKTVMKASLTAAKITDTKTLDFFSDASFTANKTGLDLALEGQSFRIVKTPAGLDQLQISNKFVSKAVPEVRINLADARTEFGKTTGSVPANAIISTLKATTNPSTVSANLGVLDDIPAKLNQLIAQSSPPSTPTTFDLADPLAGTTTYAYTLHNGRTRLQLTELLAKYAGTNWQLGRLLMTGCVNDPVPAAGCTKVAVSTLVSDAKGQVQQVFSDVVAFQPAVTAAPATATKPAVAASPAQWRLIGNGMQTQFEIAPATYAQYDSTGAVVPATLAQPNPISGVVTDFRVTGPPAASLTESLVQVPSNFSIRFSYCAQIYLCINMAPSGNVAPFSGELGDVLIRQTGSSWIGSMDTIAGARYVATYTLGATTTPVYTQYAYLGSDVPMPTQVSELPKLDVLPTRATLESGGNVSVTLNWATWAAANAHMKMKSIRLISKAASTPTFTDFTTLDFGGTNTLTFKGFAVSPQTTSYSLLLKSQDNLGRYFYSLASIPN